MCHHRACAGCSITCGRMQEQVRFVLLETPPGCCATHRYHLWEAFASYLHSRTKISPFHVVCGVLTTLHTTGFLVTKCRFCHCISVSSFFFLKMNCFSGKNKHDGYDPPVGKHARSLLYLCGWKKKVEILETNSSRNNEYDFSATGASLNTLLLI